MIDVSRVRRALALALTILALTVAAGTLGSLALLTLAAGLALVWTGAALVTTLAVRRLRVVRTVSHDEVVEGGAITLRFQVGGLGRLPARVELLGPDRAWRPLPAGDTTVELRLERRGAHLIVPSRLRVGDDLGLVRRWAQAGEPAAVLVLPAPALDGAVGRNAGEQTGDPDPDGLQPYVPGTPTTRIHWPSLARGQELQERRMAAPPTGLPLVVVDTAGTADPAAVDWLARAAAGQILRLVQTGGCRILLPGDEAPTALTDGGGHWRQTHRRLAHLHAGDGGPDGRGPVVDPHQTVYLSAAQAPRNPSPAHPRPRLPADVVPLEEDPRSVPA